ncbi:MAG: dockerin type I domain-containing protein [Candidatus Poribacteria bacterium]|nr:dockerin type I domain-containing protein [Candidatus Poribacteria bacterium]
MKFRIVISIFLLLLLSSLTFADFSITVEPNAKWGNAPISNIKRLCENVALHFQEQLREEYKLDGDLSIVYRSQGPIAFYRSYFRGAPDEYKIGLKVTGLYWSQFSYQFGHEFCHIMMNHDITHKNNPNSWFYEALCEMANIWVIKQMGETWRTRAPYPNWIDYRHALTNYANRYINDPDRQYAGSGGEWLKEWEDRMRDKNSGAFSYNKVAQLSSKIMHIFEENPEAWNAVRQISGSKGKMTEFMRDWYKNVKSEDKIFVTSIAREMGISIEETVIASSDIDADVNDDGYVDLYDVLIVRSGMQNSTSYDTDVNNDGVTDEVDLLIVKAKAMEAIVAASPRKRKVNLTTWGAMKRR